MARLQTGQVCNRFATYIDPRRQRETTQLTAKTLTADELQGIWQGPSPIVVCWGGRVLLGPAVVVEEGVVLLAGMAADPGRPTITVAEVVVREESGCAAGQQAL